MKEEKILLLQLILEDIRGYWGSNLSSRIDMALILAKELNFKQHIDSIQEYTINCTNGDSDGRFFRGDYKDGGYEGMEELHGLKPTIQDKSDWFKSQIWVLAHPELRFDDWDIYKNKEV